MKQFWIIAIICVIFGNLSARRNAKLYLPENLEIGVGSSSHQIEGAWNVSDKGESVWDHWTHNNPEKILDGSNADIATDFYYKYKEDVQRIKATGVKFFRFTISWSRVLPNGFTNEISKDGLQFYKNLTAELVANGIEPVVTLYHWDHPQVLEEYGGWTNELMVDWFVSYARIMFEELGDSVKIWATLNEPNNVCLFGYDNGPVQLAPGKNFTDTGKYICVHNMLKAHAKTYHMYDKEFRATQRGEIGIVPDCEGFLPANGNDTESVETAFQFTCGWVAHPIYHGDYPEIMKTRIAKISKAQGYEKSRLPKFSKEWLTLIKGTADYFGMTHYGTTLVAPDPDEALGTYNVDNGLVQSADPSWPTTLLPGVYVVPFGFGVALRYVKNEYGNPPVRIMENGYSDHGELKDFKRIKFHHDYLKELVIAMKRDRCNVRSYSIWTIMDDFEWNSGYTIRFGIFGVDFNDINRPRTPKLSAFWWKRVLESRQLQPVPDSRDC